MSKYKHILTGAVAGAVVVGIAWTGTYFYSGKLVTVGSTTITQKELATYLTSQAGGQAMTDMVADQLVVDAAKKYNITATDKDITAAIDDLKKQNNIATDADFNSFLSSNHITLDQLKENLKNKVLSEKLAERNVTVTDKEIQDYYNQNKAQFTTPEEVTASHILVATQAEAEAVEKRLKNGEDFAKVAKEVSIDTGSKDNGGSLGTFPKGQMVPEFDKAAFAQKVGTISDPVKSQYGWHIIKVTAHTQAVTQPLNAVKQQIIDAIKTQKAEPTTQMIAELAKEDPITILDQDYSWVKDELTNPPAQNPSQDPTQAAQDPTQGIGQ